MIRAVSLAVACLVTAVFLYTTTLATRWLRVSRLRISVPGLDHEWAGTRVAHLSDFHIGAPGMTTDHLRRARSIALSFQPDIIALTGDYYENGATSPSNGVFSEWTGGVPVFAVMGNHDRRGAPGTLDRIMDELRCAGVTILNNEAREVCIKGRTTWIAGVDDAHTFNSDVARALEDLPDGEQALLFLSHTPDAIRQLPPGRAHVLLAGHTHGGQIRLLPSGAVPFVVPIRKLRGAMPRPDGPVHRRWHRIQGTTVIVSDGLGISTLRVRFRTRPHLILLELHPAQEASDTPCDDVTRYVEEIDPENALLAWLT